MIPEMATPASRMAESAALACGRDVRLVLIASAGHSGSTLLDLLLGNHSGVSSAGEMNRLTLYPEERLCACGATVAQCPYWSGIRAQLGRALGRPRLRWDESHTDVPPQTPILELDDTADLRLDAGGPPPPRRHAARRAHHVWR